MQYGWKTLFFGIVLTAASANALEVLSSFVIPTRVRELQELGPQESTAPIVAGDILYYANSQGVVSAIHRTGGYELLRRELGFGVNGALTYARSKIFVGDNQGNLYALNSRDFSIAWQSKISSQWLSAPTVFRDKLYIVSSSDEFYVFHENGEKMGRYAERGDEKMTIRGNSSPVVFYDEAAEEKTEAERTMIYAGFSDGYLGAFTSTGDLVWRQALRTRERSRDIDMHPYVDEQGVIVATYDGTLYQLNRKTGQRQWSVKLGSYGGFLVEENRIYFSALNGNFYCLDKADGNIIWKTPYSKGVGLAPVRVGDYLAVSTSADPIYLLDPKDGKVVWTGALGAGSFAPLAVHPDGWIYAMSNYANLFFFEIRKDLKREVSNETIPANSALRHLESNTHSPTARKI